MWRRPHHVHERERIDGRVRAGAAAADAVPGLSGKIALSRLHLPAGPAMAAERTCHCAGAALLVGARLRRNRVGGLGMSRLFAGLAAMALLCITQAALAAPAAPGSVDSVQTPPRRPAPPAAAPPPPAIATRRNACALDSPGCSTACDCRASTSATRSQLRAASRCTRRRQPPRRRHQTRRPPPHKPSRKRRSAATRVTASSDTRITGGGRSIFGTRVSGGRSNRSAIATPARSGARIITGPSGADSGTHPRRCGCPAATNSERKRYCVGSGQPEG